MTTKQINALVEDIRKFRWDTLTKNQFGDVLGDCVDWYTADATGLIVEFGRKQVTEEELTFLLSRKLASLGCGVITIGRKREPGIGADFLIVTRTSITLVQAKMVRAERQWKSFKSKSEQYDNLYRIREKLQACFHRPVNAIYLRYKHPREGAIKALLQLHYIEVTDTEPDDDALVDWQFLSEFSIIPPPPLCTHRIKVKK